MIENIRCLHKNKSQHVLGCCMLQHITMSRVSLCSVASSGQKTKSLPNKIGSRNIPTWPDQQRFHGNTVQCFLSTVQSVLQWELQKTNVFDEGVQHLIHGHNRLCSSQNDKGFSPVWSWLWKLYSTVYKTKLVLYELANHVTGTLK